MVNINKLKGTIVEKGFTARTLSNKIGIDKSTFYNKINQNGLSFTIREASAIIKTLNLSQDEIITIFFADEVAQ